MHNVQRQKSSNGPQRNVPKPTPSQSPLLQTQIVAPSNRRLESFKSLMKKIQADIKTLHSKNTAFLNLADHKKSLYKKIQRIKVNIVYNKKFLKLNKTLKSTPKAQTSSKAKSDLKKHTTALAGLIVTYKKYTKSSEAVKKQRESLLTKIKSYQTPFKLTLIKYLSRKESKLIKGLSKKTLACKALEGKWKTQIA
jgi:branched-subunit amino acid aminotransferase/4-amino-4-deoxychorismate lyase